MDTNLFQIANFHQAELLQKAAQERLLRSTKKSTPVLTVAVKNILNALLAIFR